jgi:hypothetical protein
VIFSVPAFWVSQFQNLTTQKATMRDTVRADELFNTGRRYLDQNNLDGLKNVVRELWSLQPREVSEKAQRSGIISDVIR